jgi:FixJ family two-component response regulator
LVAIVDDDDDVREALSDMLLSVGVSCRAYDRAEALLATYEPGIFGCVITDVRMPGMSGFDLLRQLRRIDDSVPVMIITSDASPETRAQALAGGAHACLAKPVAHNTLLAHLQSALGRDDLAPRGT